MKIKNLNQDPTGQTWLLQTALKSAGFDIDLDNWRGPKTERALELFKQSLQSENFETDWHTVKASSFADPADVAAFKKCKALGNSDSFCFARGDNGIGAWGHNTAQEETPMCALPREIWQRAGKSGGAGVEVRFNGVTVVGILGDTMPSLANIKNGCGIDLNPGFGKEWELKPPFMVTVQWRWI